MQCNFYVVNSMLEIIRESIDIEIIIEKYPLTF